MNCSGTNSPISFHGIQTGKCLLSPFVGGLIGILTFLSLSGCGPTGLSGTTKKDSVNKASEPPAATFKEAQKAVQNNGAADAETESKTVTKETANEAVPAIVVKPDVQASVQKSVPQPVDVVLEVEMWVQGRDKYRNCLKLSVNDGPVVDFGCDRTNNFVLAELDTDGRLRIKRTVKALPKTYCNKISVYASSTDKSLVTTLFDSKDPNVLNGNDAKKRILVFDTSDGVDDKTNVNTEVAVNGMFDAARSFPYTIDSKNMMKFAIENAKGCSDQSLLKPI